MVFVAISANVSGLAVSGSNDPQMFNWNTKVEWTDKSNIETLNRYCNKQMLADVLFSD